MFRNGKLTAVLLFGVGLAIALTFAIADEGEEAVEFEATVKVDTRTPDGTKTKLKARGTLEIHEHDGEFSVSATTKDGTQITMDGDLAIGARGAYGTGTLTVGTPGTEPPSVGVLFGKMKDGGHKLRATFYVVDAANGFALSKVKISGNVHEEHPHEE
jgi:hypothetical protein